tara:strand:+ start:976 stop:1536 length:561 start_codon:yes stop_codon:yes gene_type:complete
MIINFVLLVQVRHILAKGMDSTSTVQRVLDVLEEHGLKYLYKLSPLHEPVVEDTAIDVTRKRSAKKGSWDVITVAGEDEYVDMVAWTPKEGKGHLYGEVLVLDISHGTNNRKRPFVDVLTIDGERKPELVLYGFLPNEQRGSHSWILSRAIPDLLGIAFCERVSILIADGDVVQKEMIIGLTCQFV